MVKYFPMVLKNWLGIKKIKIEEINNNWIEFQFTISNIEFNIQLPNFNGVEFTTKNGSNRVAKWVGTNGKILHPKVHLVNVICQFLETVRDNTDQSMANRKIASIISEFVTHQPIVKDDNDLARIIDRNKIRIIDKSKRTGVIAEFQHCLEMLEKYNKYISCITSQDEFAGLNYSLNYKNTKLPVEILTVPFRNWQCKPTRYPAIASILKSAVRTMGFEEPIIDTNNNLPHPPGLNALTVFMNGYKGLIHEDGIVISKSFANKLRTAKKIVYTIYDAVDTVKLAEAIEPYQRIAVLEDGTEIKAYKNKISGRVYDIQEFEQIDIVGKKRRTTKIYIWCEYYASIGDKISNRYGMKGVISGILPDDEMPQVIINKGFNFSIFSKENIVKHAEVICNAPSVLRRKNFGQIMEALVSKVDQTPRKIKESEFNTKKKIEEYLLINGYEPDGREDILFPENGKIQRCIAGWNYWMRLDKFALDLLNICKDNVPYDRISRKQSSGNGSSKFGIADILALSSLEMNETLKEIALAKNPSWNKYQTLKDLADLEYYDYEGYIK